MRLRKWRRPFCIHGFLEFLLLYVCGVIYHLHGLLELTNYFPWKRLWIISLYFSPTQLVPALDAHLINSLQYLRNWIGVRVCAGGQRGVEVLLCWGEETLLSIFLAPLATIRRWKVNCDCLLIDWHCTSLGMLVWDMFKGHWMASTSCYNTCVILTSQLFSLKKFIPNSHILSVAKLYGLYLQEKTRIWSFHCHCNSLPWGQYCFLLPTLVHP